ncbi:MAG: hypothetical protein ACLRSW_00565 [Christensenellaceae bacterium]
MGTLSVSVPFSANPAGDYTVAVTAMDAGSGKSDTTTRFYKNKALARVSSFTVVEPSSLVFEGVNGAERYYISVECGNAAHNHTRFFLGSSNHFNFSDCPMTEEGIRFTVTAEADGYAPSVSRTFVYNRTLSAVTGLHFDEGEQKLVWDAVPERPAISFPCVAGIRLTRMSLSITEARRAIRSRNARRAKLP